MGIGRKKWWAESVADGQAREVGVVTKKLYRTRGCGGGAFTACQRRMGTDLTEKYKD